ncbi:MAG: FAD-binding oxidoreductase [Rhizobiales bacterium]|nr:FAD-binding oxidoreductase [Hyphomicrobiales bacterium]MBI3674063.1 FAD-binding oxidoreductase [Hyphomicrobiales bacterium]
MTSPHATIIGAGIVGISTAAFLQRAGFAVTVIDRVPPGEGCSFGNAGGIAFAEVVPTVHPRILLKIPGWLMDPLGPLTIRWSYLPKALPWFLAAGRNAMPDRVKAITAARASLGLRVVADFETLLKSANAHDLMVYQDTLRLFDNEKQFAAEAGERAIKKLYGYDTKRLSAGEVREIEPAVSPGVHCGAFHGGWYFVSDPERVVKSIAADVTRNGGTILADDVSEIVTADGRATQLRLKSGALHSLDRLVVCAGAYSHLLARRLGDRVLLEAERGYHMVLPNSGVSLSRSITYARTPAAATPMKMGLRLAGSDEFAGLDAEPNYARADALWKNFKRILPGLREPDSATTRWMGRRPGTPDSLPVIGPSKYVSNVWYGFGHSHMGLTWGPTTGRLLGELMTGAKSNIDLSAFRVDRF